MCAYSVFNTFPVYPLSAKPLILLAFCRYRYHTSLLITPESTLGDLIIKAGGTLVNADPNSYTPTLVIGNRTNFYIASKSEIPDTCVVTDIEKVNINTATKEQLATISGLTNSQIESILNYRNNTGMFYCLEDVMNVSGIGEKTYLLIRDKIVVA